jgi:hypothetical protein
MVDKVMYPETVGPYPGGDLISVRIHANVVVELDSTVIFLARIPRKEQESSGGSIGVPANSLELARRGSNLSILCI